MLKSKNTCAILMLLAVLLFTLLVHFMSVRRVEGFEEMMKEEMMKEEMMKNPEMMKQEMMKNPEMMKEMMNGKSSGKVSEEDFKKLMNSAK